MSGVRSNGQKKELFLKGKSSDHEKRKHRTHRKNGCKLLFQICVHFGQHSGVSFFSCVLFSLYFIIETRNVSMLPGFFLCKKVSLRTRQILATLPKNQNPSGQAEFWSAIPSKTLYIKVWMCYHNTCLLYTSPSPRDRG